MDFIQKRTYGVLTILYILFAMLPFAGIIFGSPSYGGTGFGLRQVQLLGNSLKLGLLTVSVSVPLGFFGALCIYHSRLGSKWYRYYFVLLLPVPFYIYALSWMYFLKVIGLVFPTVLKFSVKGLGACLFVEILAYYPLVMLFALIGMENMNNDDIKMACVYRDDNAVVFFVILKSIFPCLLAAAGLILLLSLTEFSVPSMFQYNTYTLNLFSVYSRTGDAGLVYRLCLPLSLLLIVPLTWFLNSIDSFGMAPKNRDRYRLKLHGILKGLCLMAAAVSVLQIVIPVFTFLVTSKGFGIIVDAMYHIRGELASSAWMSFWSGLTAVLMAYFPAVYVCETGQKRIWLLLLYTAAFPGSIQAMGLLKVVNVSFLYPIQKSVILASFGCALKYTPLLIVWFAVVRMRMDQRRIELARLYALNAVSHIGMEMRMALSSIVVGFWLVFFLTFAEEGIPLILMAPGKETVTVKIYNYLHYGASEYVSAFSLIVSAFILTLEIVFVVASRACMRRRKPENLCRQRRMGGWNDTDITRCKKI